ncbi:MAG: TetR/AcrR family transcriptional regulator [Acidimicrobiales bacterium]
MDSDKPIDGRRARRTKSRQAVIEAMFDLVQEGKVPPEIEDVAERAGVSVSSVFRNFDGIGDLQHQALQWFQQQYGHLFEVNDADESLADRLRSHVRSRVMMADEVGPLLRLARARAVDHEKMVGSTATVRGRMAEQTRQRFAKEIRQLSPAQAANLTALIDSTTSLEAYEVMTAAHARSSRQITTAWIGALEAFLAPVLANESETPS